MKNGGMRTKTVKLFDRNNSNISFGLYLESKEIEIVFEGYASLF